MADTSKITLGQLKTALTQAKNYTDNEIASVTGVSKVEPEELDMPKVFFYGNALPTTKNNVDLTMDYVSNTTKFSSFIKLKCQGTSSMSYDKKNFTVAMFSDEARATKLKKDFKGWGAQSKFCLKANWVDTTHTRNLSGARIAYDMVNSRPDSPFKQQLLQCPRNGAVDGFPIKLYFNGEFYGIYTWNIPKDGWMFNMDKSNPNHIVLCAERNTDGNADAINSCQFRKLWDGTDGGDWSYEFGTPSNTVKDSLNRCIGFVMNSTDQEFHDNIGQYFDLYSLLDYYCFSYLTCHLDGLAKNMLMVTYDGVIWGASLYDMDSIYGVHWNGNSFVSPQYQCPEQYQEQFSRLWVRIEQCFATELYARYLELRQGALSLSNIIKHVEEIYDVIPDRVFADEKAKWTNLPQVNTNTITRFRNYMRDRAAYVDAQMQAIGTAIPCTGIVLGADTLSFTTTDTQTLSVVVSPTNCTDTVNWSVSPTDIVTVDNGVVTPIANGSCTITATCGSYSDTCSVTVALPTVECTGITLDKSNLTLGVVEGGTTDSYGDLGINLLNGAEWLNGTINESTGSVNTGGTDKYTVINVSTQGTYTLSSKVGYTYKKIIVYDTDDTFIYSVGGLNDVNDIIVNITKPCIVKITAFPNNLDWDGSALSFIGAKLSENITNKDVSYTLTASDINFKYANSEYTFVELFLDTTYSNVKIFECDGINYVTINKALLGANDTKLNNLVVAKDSGYIYTSVYNNKTFLSVALPLAYGTTSDEILANMTSKTITINSTDGLAKLEIFEKLSYQLTATVTPENCTQPVVWSVSPEGIVTVNNGNVRAVSNGQATVTATCGTQSATCAVTVSGMSEGGGNTDTTLLYSLPGETVFNGTSDYIDTGVALLSTDQDFTIVLDVIASASQASNEATLLHCMHEISPYPGLSCMVSAGANGFCIPKGNNASVIGQNPYLIPKSRRAKAVIIKEGTTLSAYNSNGVSGSSTYTYSQVNENLLIGAYQQTNGNKGRYFSGTVYDFKIYNKAFTSQEKDDYLNTSTGTNTSKVFKIDSTSMNTTDNTLTDNIAGIIATLTGNPTVSDNQIVFTANDTFSFDISSLNLTNSNRTFRIKFTPTTLDNNPRNVIEVGGDNSWGHTTSAYITNEKLILQHGSNSFANTTVGSADCGNSDNRLSTAPVTGQEYELVISENGMNGNVRWFVDGVLVQNGTTTLFNSLYLCNTEGDKRFIGSYSLIEIYNVYCNNYTEFTNMINNTNYLANASWQAGTMDYNQTGMSTSSNDMYTSVQIPAGKYILTSSNAKWKKYRLNDSKGNVVYYNAGGNNTTYLIIDTAMSDDTNFTLEVSYFRENDTTEAPSLITTTETNITTLTLDGSLSYSIPNWKDNPSGENGQVNVDYLISDINAVPMVHKFKGYTYNDRLSYDTSKGLSKQYKVNVWQGHLYLSFTLDMAETGVTNDVNSITNYLRSNPLTFKYIK